MKRLAEQDASTGSGPTDELDGRLFDIKQDGCMYARPMGRYEQRRLQATVEGLLKSGAITKSAIYKEANIHIKKGKKLNYLSRREYGLAITLYNAAAEGTRKELREALELDNN